MNSRFVDDDNDSSLNEVPEVQAEAVGKKIITYGMLDKRRMPSTMQNIKIPNKVIDFIQTNAEEGAVMTVIIARMLEIGMEELTKELLVSDVEIKF